MENSGSYSPVSVKYLGYGDQFHLFVALSIIIIASLHLEHLDLDLKLNEYLGITVYQP